MDTTPAEQPMLFISDAHLGGFSKDENERIEAELIQLINYCQRNDIHIAILGDLFDYWMEYPYTVPSLGEKLLKRFSSYNKALGPTLYITGNHDNWTRNHFSTLGFELLHEYQLLALGENTIMVMHGDGLSNNDFDLPRPPLHRLLRNETFVEWYQKILPPSLGITFMKYFSRVTRWLEWNPEKEKVLDRWARQTLQQGDIDVIICGHDHIPRRKHFDFGTYINLGTFYKHRTLAYYNNESISLVSWVPRLQSLQPFENDIDE